MTDRDETYLVCEAPGCRSLRFHGRVGAGGVRLICDACGAVALTAQAIPANAVAGRPPLQVAP